MIKLDKVLKRYSNDTTIGETSIDIPESGIISLIGPNGAGKSTTLLMIGRLLPMDSGSIQVGSMDIANSKSKDVAKILAILKQENHFITKLTVRQLVAFGRFPYSGGRLTQNDQAIIDKYIDFLDLEDLQDRYLDELSGGQRQRAYVAMVLCQETEYILLDEPLNNLDVAKSVQMLKHLREAAKEFGRTIILVLHDINFAAQYSDKICAMKDGSIHAFGSPNEIMKSDLLTEIFDTKIDIIETEKGPIAVY